MRIYISFDKASVPESIREKILLANKSLSSLGNDLYAFDFNPVIFTHAWQLVATSSTRFGNDLSMYLAGAKDFFLRKPESEMLHLAFGTSDFKRRMSEDLGVAIASLFMVESYGIEWHTITQIPENRNLIKTRPDFEAFDASDNRYIYEAKGRSSLNKVIEAIDKALSQIKSYPEPAVQKMAIITYLCGDQRAFPSHSFVLDPQLPDNLIPNRIYAEMMHFLNVLDFGGLHGSKKAYLNLLRARFAFNSAEEAGTINRGHENKVERAEKAFSNTYDEEIATKIQFEFEEKVFVGQKKLFEPDGHFFEFMFGIRIDTKNRILNKQSSKLVEQNKFAEKDKEVFSLFSDGTLLKLTTN